MYIRERGDKDGITNTAVQTKTTVGHVFQEWSDKLMGRAQREFLKSPIKWLEKYHG